MTNPIILPPGSVIEVAAPALPDLTTVAPGPTNVLIMPVPGATGKTGAAGDNANIYNEKPAGTQDGTNEVFSLANDFTTRSTIVFRNGLREQLGYSYHETPPNQITFTTAPLVDDVLTVDYLVEGG